MTKAKLYKLTHPNETISYILARNMTEAVEERNNVLPCGYIDTVDKIERINELHITDNVRNMIWKEAEEKKKV